MKAQRAALEAPSQEHLDGLLAQFGPEHAAGLLERLRPHLTFEPALLVDEETPKP